MNKPITIGTTCSLGFYQRLQAQLPKTIQLKPVLEMEYTDHPEVFSLLQQEVQKGPVLSAFCSRHGARQFVLWLQEHPDFQPQLKNIQLAAIGKDTAQILEQAGLCVAAAPEPAGSASLEQLIRSQIQPQQKILLFRSGQDDKHLLHSLQKQLDASQLDLYDLKGRITKPLPKSLDGLLFASRTAIDAWLEEQGPIDPDLPVFCISSACAHHLQQKQAQLDGYPVTIHYPLNVSSRDLAACIQTGFPDKS